MTLLHQAAQKAVEAAQAVVARWETPLWKDAPPTAKVIYKMRDAMNELESALQQPEPGELALVIEQDPESGWWRVAGTPESGIYIAHPSVDACIADILPTWRLLAETAPQQVPPVPALQHQEVPSTAVIPPAPPECETEDEKTAFAFGYWQGLHAARKGQEVPREPVAMPDERIAALWDESFKHVGGNVYLRAQWLVRAAAPSTTQQQEAPSVFDDLIAFEEASEVKPTFADALGVALAAKKRAQQQEAGNGWRPIESAPKDGTEILVWRDDAGAFMAMWTCVNDLRTTSDKDRDELDEDTLFSYDWFGGDAEGNFRCDGSEAPTLWQPMPAAPSTPESAEKDDAGGGVTGGEGQR